MDQIRDIIGVIWLVAIALTNASKVFHLSIKLFSAVTF